MTDLVRPMLHGVEGYYDLHGVYVEAYEQATHGKGSERHGRGLPFCDQPMMRIGRMTGPSGPAFQAMKKIQEAIGMMEAGRIDNAIFELHGAMNYVGGAVLLAEDMKR